MQDSATTGPIGKAGADDAGAGKRKRPGWDNLSYTCLLYTSRRPDGRRQGGSLPTGRRRPVQITLRREGERPRCLSLIHI